MGSYRVCMCFTWKYRVTEAEPPLDVKEAFNNFTGGNNHMTPDQFCRFLVESQGDTNITIVDAEAKVEQIIQKRHHLFKFAKKTLTLDDFHHYLFSPDFNPPIGSKEVHQDMSAPLSHYFIYTGHNSYLTGNQLSSDCSDVPIIQSLQRGVRVIELDLWPNSSKDEIHVVHGNTLTAPVDLMKCLKSIKEHAFVASEYPLVITLEDHLTPHLQAKVAQMLTQIFGEVLFCPESETIKEFSSPESLKGRIIISTKPPQEYLESKEDKQTDSMRKNKDSDEDDEWGQEPSELTAPAVKEDHDKCESDVSSDQSLEPADSEELDPKLNHQPSSYKRLIAIHAGKPKGGLKCALIVEPDKVRRLSLSEQELEKAAENHGKDVVRFTQKNILRIYPKGTRFNSSNYNPLVGWLHGAQMVAFNMQGYGRSLWLMQGMFRSNGGCGYVKKPDFLMNGDYVFSPRAELQVKTTLKVKIYMGDGWHLDFKKTHFDSYSPPDFYTRVGIAGAPADKMMKRTKTKDNNWTPVWNEEFVFPLKVPELALLRIEVHEYDVSKKDDFAGQTCLPVSELRPGIRAVPLCNRKGETYKSVKLLMRFEFV